MNISHKISLLTTNLKSNFILDVNFGKVNRNLYPTTKLIHHIVKIFGFFVKGVAEFFVSF